MGETERTYDPAFIEWWNRQTLSAKVALALSPMHYAAQAWEEATRLVKADCGPMHRDETEVRSVMLDALKDAARELNFIVNTQERRGGLYERALNNVRAAISKAEGKQ